MIRDNSFTGNGGHGAMLSGVTAMNYGGNSGSGNGINGIAMTGWVSDSISWDPGASGFPYVLNGLLTSSQGKQLTLQPGCLIKGEPNSRLKVQGSLVSAGIQAMPVRYTSIWDDAVGGDANGDGSATQPAPGDWKGVYRDGNSGGAGSGTFDWSELSYGGSTQSNGPALLHFFGSDDSWFRKSRCQFSETEGLSTRNCSPSIENSQFHANGRNGIKLISGLSPDIHDCLFTDNAHYGAMLSGGTPASYGGNSGSGNGSASGMAVGGSLESNETWTAGAPEFPYLFPTVGLMINSGSELTLEAGCVLKFNSNNLHLSGKATAAGSSAAPVVLTSIKDDTASGDSNPDGAATLPAPGDWTTIYLYGSGSSQGSGHFLHTHIRYGGSSLASLRCFEADSVSFQDGRIEFGAGRGVEVYQSSPVVAGTRIADHVEAGVWVRSGVPRFGSADGTVGGGNTFRDNDGGGFHFVNDSPNDLEACYNDWGVYTATAIDSLIEDVEEQFWTGVVHASPWAVPGGKPTITSITTALADSVHLVWTPVIGASGYTVYSSSEPWTGFTPDMGGVMNGIS